jgi:hypothetical protein
VPQSIEHLGPIFSMDQVVDTQLEKLTYWSPNNLAETRIDKPKPASRVHLSQTDFGVAQHGAKILLVPREFGFDTLSLRDLSADDET